MGDGESGVTRRGFLGGALVSGGLLASASGKGVTPAVDPAVRTHVNGEPLELTSSDETALEALRSAGLTGPKLGCGHGACGACAVLLDGEPVNTCILPSTSLHGREVRTVEGLGSSGLHAVQRAFLAEDALQCGYCTPGFVTAAAAFCDTWRAAHGASEPPREAVADALAGHICRCGAYAAIERAVLGACAGRYDDYSGPGARREALAKVTGAARYTTDIRLPEQLDAYILRSPVAHGAIRVLDIEPARSIPGVRAVISLSGSGRRVRFAGQELAAVAAESGEAGRAGLAAIRLEIEPAPVAVGIEGALGREAPQVYPEDRRTAPSASEFPQPSVRWERNLRGPFSLPSIGSRPGGAKKRLVQLKMGEREGQVLRDTWRLQTQLHACLEPHAAVAHWRGAALDVYLSTQACELMQREIAERWDLEHDAVRVLCEHVGGGFGAKATLQPEAMIAIDLAREAGRPVRCVLDRSEESVVGGLRPGAEVRLAVGVDAKGAPVALSMRALHDSGVAVGNSLGFLFRVIYPGMPKFLRDYDVVSHAAPGKPHRGPGGKQAFFALEGALDTLAHERGDDPIALRRLWDPSPIRNRLYDWAEGLPAWRDRGPVGADSGRFRRGVGMASGAWMYFAVPRTQVSLRLEQGTITAASATQDIGTGTRSVIAAGVVDELGVEPAHLVVRVGDSRDVRGPTSGGSRTATSVYPAARDAARQLCAELVAFAEGHFGLSGARWEAGAVVYSGGVIQLEELARIAPSMEFIGRRGGDERAWFVPFSVDGGMRVGKAIPASVQLAEVEVDTHTGRVRVTRTWGGFGVGRLLVPKLARSQAEGALIQGLSYALYEERRLDPATGHQLTLGFEDYRIAGLGDCPEITLHFDEAGFEWVPGGGVGLGELVNVAVPAAIANAVFHATGWRPRELPIRPDRVLAGLKELG